MVDYLPVTLPEDPKEAQKVFNSLSIEHQLNIVLQARGKDRLHYLFLSEHPRSSGSATSRTGGLFNRQGGRGKGLP